MEGWLPEKRNLFYHVRCKHLTYDLRLVRRWRNVSTTKQNNDMKHRVTITVEVDPTGYSTGVYKGDGYTPKLMRDTDANAVKIVEVALKGQTDWDSPVTITCGTKSVRRRIQ